MGHPNVPAGTTAAPDEEAGRAVERAIDWLLQSGIQDPDRAGALGGGVRAWYDRDAGAFAFHYTEITGYFITTCVHLFEIFADRRFLARAREAAGWLARVAQEPRSGALRCRFTAAGPDRRACAFDNGVCLNALVNLYGVTGDPRCLDLARRIGDWLLRAMQRPDGALIAKYDLDTGTAHNPGGRWSLVSGSYLLKTAIGLLNLARATGDTRFERAARALCAWGAAQQAPDGRFATDPESGDTFLHPHCYGAEGLLVAGTVLGERRWVEAARRAVGWIAPRQRDDGGFPAVYERDRQRFVPVQSAEMTAQVLRLWLLLPEHARRTLPLDAGAAVRAIIGAQCRAGRREADGGFTAGSAWFHGEAHDHAGRHVNAWVTMIVLQTLLLYGGARWSPFLLV